MAHESWLSLSIAFLVHFFLGRLVQGIIKVQWVWIAPTMALVCFGIYYWPFQLFSLPFSLASVLGIGIGTYLRQMADD